MRMNRFVIPICLVLLAISVSGCGKQETVDNVNSAEPNVMGAIKAYIPAPKTLTLKGENVYDYMGISFHVPEELTALIESKEVFVQCESNVDEDGILDYAYIYFNVVPEEQKDVEVREYDEFEEWLENTYRYAALGVYDCETLEGEEVVELTGCKDVDEIGTASSYRFFFADNIDEEMDLNTVKGQGKDLDSMMYAVRDSVKVSIPVRMPSDYPVNILSQKRTGQDQIGDFQTFDIYGKPVTSDIFSDYKLTLVNVLTTWCSPCVGEIPHLSELNEELKGEGFNVIGIVMDAVDGQNGDVIQEKVDVARQVCEKTGVSYDMIIPDDVLLNGRLKGIAAYPETFFVDQTGKIVGDTVVGADSKEGWLKTIEKELEGLK